MKFVSFALLILFAVPVCAQTDTTAAPVVDSGTVKIYKDPRLDQLVNKQATINEVTSRDARRTDKGFRLMIISTTNRDEAIAAKTKIYTYFPDLKAYLWYQSPYFRLKAGNFKERKEAEEYQKRLNVYFPRGVFIMKDTIEVKPGKGTEQDEI